MIGRRRRRPPVAYLLPIERNRCTVRRSDLLCLTPMAWNLRLLRLPPPSSGRVGSPALRAELSPLGRAQLLAVFRRLAAVLQLTTQIAQIAGKCEQHAEFEARLAIFRAQVAAGDSGGRLALALADSAASSRRSSPPTSAVAACDVEFGAGLTPAPGACRRAPSPATPDARRGNSWRGRSPATPCPRRASARPAWHGAGAPSSRSPAASAARGGAGVAAEAVRLAHLRQLVLLERGAGCFSSSSISPSSSRAGTMRPGVTMCFSLRSSRSAAARISFSASSRLPRACAIHAGGGERWISTSVAQ